MSRPAMQALARHRTTLLFAAALVAIAFAVHGPVLRYPYMSDDWPRIGSIPRSTTLHTLSWAFDPAWDHWRPAVLVYFLALYHLSGFEALGSHLALFALFVAGALALAALIARLTGDRVLAALVAVSYVAANRIHLDLLMVHGGGVESFGSLLCFFGAALLFVERRERWSAVVCAVGLLFKETLILLPPFAVLCSTVDGSASPAPRLRASVARLWPHAPVLLGYAVIKWLGPPMLKPDAADPYHVSFAVKDLARTLVAYLRVTLDGIAPRFPAPLAAALVIGGVAAIALRRPLASPLRRQLLPLFAGWFALGIAPLLFFPNHLYRYYLALALPAALAVAWGVARTLLAWIAGSDSRGDRIAFALALVLCLVSALDFRGRVRDGADLDLSNFPLAQGSTVLRVSAFLRAAPPLPHGATLLFDGINIVAFGRKAGPRIWCRDDDLTVFRFGAPTPNPDKTFVVGQRGQELFLEPLASYRPSPSP